MRLLLLLIIAGVAAYFTVPQRAAHEEAAAAFLEGRELGEARGEGGITLDSVIGYVKGMLAGEGRYENYIPRLQIHAGYAGGGVCGVLGRFHPGPVPGSDARRLSRRASGATLAPCSTGA